MIESSFSSFNSLKNLILISLILMMTLKRLKINDLRSESDDDSEFKDLESSVDEIEFSTDDDALILTDSLANYLTEWVLLLTVNWAYKRVDDDVNVRLILELFIYVWFFERSDFFYTFSSLNVIDLMRLISIKRKQLKSWSSSENYWTDCSDFYWKRSD